MSKKFIILMTVFIDVLGIGIIIPVLPFYVESFGASDFIVTLLFAVFSFFSFFSAPLLGAWSDRIGRRPVLIASIASTALGWFVFALSTNIIWLFIGRIIDGLAAGNFPIAQSYLIDIAKNDKEKTTNLGLIGAIFGIGFIIGPVIGGTLSQISLSLPFYFVGVLATINMILAFKYLPETNKNINVLKKIEFNPIKPIWESLKKKNLRYSFIAWFLFGTALAGQQAILSLYLNRKFHFDSLTISLFFAGMGAILILNQVVFLKKVWLKYFSENKIIIAGTLFLSLSFFLMGVNYLLIIVIGSLLLSFSQSSLRVVLTSQVVKKALINEQGMILGVMASVMSLSMIVGPIIAGILFTIKFNLPFFASAILSVAAFVIVYCDINCNNSAPSKLSEEELKIAEQKIEFIS